MKRMTKRSRYIVVVAIVVFISGILLSAYKIDINLEAIYPSNTIDYRTKQDESFNMKRELNDLLKLHHQVYLYQLYNHEGVKYLRQLIDKDGDPDNSILESELTYQYLLAGYPDSAIALISQNTEVSPSMVYAGGFQYLLEQARKRLGNYTSLFRASYYDVNKQLGLCYLRIGEQANCQLNHNSESCIIPFTPAAYHQDSVGSTRAIDYFQSTTGSTSRWLMNIASQTLGQYPDGLEKDKLINFSKYEALPIGIHFDNKAMELGINYNGYYGATIVEDFNNDQYLDIFVTSGRLQDNVMLYYNDQKGSFISSSNDSLSGITGGVNAIQADYNNDGLTDILILRGGWMEYNLHPVSLLRNNGNKTFTDVTYESGLLTYFPSHTAAWFDFNLDGYLDLFVGNESGYSKLYKNMQDGTFYPLPDSCLLLSQLVKGAFAADFNNDDLPDLYVSCYNDKNHLYINRGQSKEGKYIFEDIAESAGVSNPIRSFPVSVFDFNNDGFMDIFCTSYCMDMSLLADQYIGKQRDFEHPVLYLNKGDETFTELNSQNLDRSLLAMGMNFGDIDNDGFLDIYMGTGYPEFEALVPNLLFRNKNGTDLEDVTNSTRLGHLQKGHGIGFGDFDQDGDQDIYASFGGFYQADNFDNALFVNSGNNNNWAVFKFEGAVSNRSAIGTKVTIWINEKGNRKRKIYREVNSGGSYGSSSLQLEVGLGKAVEIDKVEVHWPASGINQQFINLPVNTAYKIVENNDTITTIDYSPFKLTGSNLMTNMMKHHHK